MTGPDPGGTGTGADGTRPDEVGTGPGEVGPGEVGTVETGPGEVGTVEVDAQRDPHAAPRLLSHLADPIPLPPPLHDAEEVASLHRKWAQLAGAAQGSSQGVGDAAEPTGGGGIGGGIGGGVGGGVRAKVRARVVAVARADSAGDRALIGDLIRAVDAVAARLDDVTARVGNLEVLVQEVLDRLSEDLVRVQAALGTLDDRARDEP